MKSKIVKLIWKAIPDKFLYDSKGCPTALSWDIHKLLVKLHLAKEIKITKGPFRIMWGDKEITNIRSVEIK